MIQQFGESLESRWYREHSLRIHKRHLEEIRQRSKSTIKAPLHHVSINLRKLSQESDKQKEIHRENLILSSKLYEIQERRIMPGEPRGPRSLNFSVRRKEAERILTENYDFVRRFMVKPSFVSTSKFEEDYRQQLGYKKTISKANLHKRLSKLALFDGKPGYLPPLDTSIFEQNSKSRTEAPSKLTNVLSNESEIVEDSKVSEEHKSVDVAEGTEEAENKKIAEEEQFEHSPVPKKKEKMKKELQKNLVGHKKDQGSVGLKKSHETGRLGKGSNLKEEKKNAGYVRDEAEVKNNSEDTGSSRVQAGAEVKSRRSEATEEQQEIPGGVVKDTEIKIEREVEGEGAISNLKDGVEEGGKDKEEVSEGNTEKINESKRDLDEERKLEGSGDDKDEKIDNEEVVEE